MRKKTRKKLAPLSIALVVVMVVATTFPAAAAIAAGKPAVPEDIFDLTELEEGMSLLRYEVYPDMFQEKSPLDEMMVIGDILDKMPELDPGTRQALAEQYYRLLLEEISNRRAAQRR